MEAAMGLMRRMHPKHVDTAISALLSLMPEQFFDLLSQVDQPLQLVCNCLDHDSPKPFPLLQWYLFPSLTRNVSGSSKEGYGGGGLIARVARKIELAIDQAPIQRAKHYLMEYYIGRKWHLKVLCNIDSGKEFILCEYNREADSYRSPWSNKYHPQLEEVLYPSLELRKLEIEANDVFAVYHDQWFEVRQGRRGYLHEGEWDAIHVIEVGPEEDGTSHYCLTSTVMLSLTTDNKSCGTFSLSGSIRRQVYFGKTRGMVCTLRWPAELAQQDQKGGKSWSPSNRKLEPLIKFEREDPTRSKWISRSKLGSKPDQVQTQPQLPGRRFRSLVLHNKDPTIVHHCRIKAYTSRLGSSHLNA
ncbi:hypothetical protein Nepgr_010453 [Nepenthes gracilis]|uniref:F-actin-capping protein subunit beta n=1 Tax=Nepenthes gracilis TaxID=150966 RepID=A0AAD3SCD4_NEPGR|nr:hypothetical protein Nepgr_010453 [Nepenthes gracilis]